VAPGAVAATGADLYGTAQRLVEAGRSAYQRALAAELQTEGLLDGLVGALGNDAGEEFRRCAEYGVLGAGAVTRWSMAIMTFNGGVDELNAEYAAAKATNFGHVAPEPRGGMTADSYEAAIDHYEDRVLDADAALLAELRRRHGDLETVLDDEAAAVAGLLDRGPSEHALLDLFQSGALPVGVGELLPGVSFDQTPCGQDAAVEEALTALADADRAAVEPDALYREWVERLVGMGLSTDQIVDRAEQEEVGSDTFDDLEGLEVMRDPQGRPFVLLDDDEGAADIARVVEILNGGQPSVTDTRRSNNEWTYDGFLTTSDSDVEFVLDNGGAIVATPEGTVMAAPGPGGVLPNPVDLFSSRGGTTWMEMFVLNGSYDDPAGHLRDIIERGSLDEASYSSDDLEWLLRHEWIHSEQWAEYGLLELHRPLPRRGHRSLREQLRGGGGSRGWWVLVRLTAARRVR